MMIDILIWILAVFVLLIILSFLIITHEAGHFLVAKKFGVRVYEFALGLPPKIFSRKKGDTKYILNALPLGGYVQLEGENPTEEVDVNSPTNFQNKPPIQRLLILVAGTAVHFVLAYFLFFVLILWEGDISVDPVIESFGVSSFAENSQAMDAGVEVGDKILSLNGVDVALYQGLGDLSSQYAGKEVVVEVQRGDEFHEFSFQSTAKDGESVLGLMAYPEIDESSIPKVSNPIEAMYWPLKAEYSAVNDTFVLFSQMLGGIFTKFEVSDDVSGPIGITTLVESSVRTVNLSFLWYLTAVLAANFAVINLFPIPALDGGRIIFVIYEMITKKKFPPEKEGIIHGIGFFFLIGLMAVIAYKDIIHLFH